MFTLVETDVIRWSKARVSLASKYVPNIAKEDIRTEANRTLAQPYSVEYQFINCTGIDICITDRMNITTSFKPMVKNHYPEDLHNYFVIRVLRHWASPPNKGANYRPVGKEVIFDRYDILNDYGKINNHPNLSVLKQALDGRRVNRRINGIVDFNGRKVDHGFINMPADCDQTMSMEYWFHKDFLGNSGRFVYCKDTDYVVSVGHESIDGKPLHPYSTLSEDLGYSVNPHEQDVKSSSFNYTIEIVDDDMTQFGDRYVNINGEVSLVRSRRSQILQPGIHIFKTDIVTGKIDRKFLRFDQSEEIRAIGLFRDISEAQYHGDLKTINELILLKERKAAAEAQSIIEQKKREDDLEKQRIQSELHIRKLEAEAQEREFRKQREDELYRRSAEALDEQNKARQKAEEAESKKRFWDGFFRLGTATVGLTVAVIGLIIKIKSTK